MQGAAKNVHNFNARPRPGVRPNKHKTPLWSHQKEIAELKGEVVKLHFGFGGTPSTITGKVLEVDQFTIKARSVGTGKEGIYFKHAISAIELEPRV